MNEFFLSSIRIQQSQARVGISFHRLVIVLSVAALILCMSACASKGIFTASDREVLGKLMVERLEWMDEVAVVKKARSLPVNDPVREAQLLDAMEALAVKSDLPAEQARVFFSGQMMAAKQRQEECLKEALFSKQAPQPVPDLVKTIRPALDLIGRKMIAALVRARDSKESSQVIDSARMRLKKAGYSNAVIVPAIHGLEAGLSENKHGEEHSITGRCWNHDEETLAWVLASMFV